MKIYDKVELINIEEIKPYFNNPRRNEKAVNALIQIIPRVGFNVPIFIDQQKIIIKGHSRYYAALKLGIKQLPCIISENTDSQNQADRIYDNAVHDLSEWNLDRLSLEIRDLEFTVPEIQFDMDKLSAYKDMKNLLNDPTILKDLQNAEKKQKDEIQSKEKNLIPLNCDKCGNEMLIDVNDLARYKRLADKTF